MGKVSMRPLGASVYFLFEIVLTRNIKHSVFCLQEIDDRYLVTILALAENALSGSTLRFHVPHIFV
jgi:hypothetical protein